jgi:hypothetical protein
MTKRSYIIFAAVCVVIVIGAAWLILSSRKSHPAAPTSVMADVTASQLPQGFPANLPIEPGATLTQNYTTTNPAGNLLAVREFVSKKTMAENFALYKNFLITNGWSITFTLDAADQKVLNAQKENIQSRVRTYTANDQVIVTLQAITGK